MDRMSKFAELMDDPEFREEFLKEVAAADKRETQTLGEESERLRNLISEYRNCTGEFLHDECRVSFTRSGQEVDARCNLCREYDALFPPPAPQQSTDVTTPKEIDSEND
jgi:hypothetical protein